MNRYCAVAILIGVCLMFTGGCTEETMVETPSPVTKVPSQTATATATPGTAIPENSDLSYQVMKIEEQWGKDDVSREWECVIKVVNTGTTDIRNVKIILQLIDKADGSVRDIDTQTYTRFNAGESKQFTKKLDGDRGHSYRLNIDIV